MNGYGKVDKVYRPLGIGIINSDRGRFIFTIPAVQGGNDGYQNITEGDEVEYRVFDGEIEGKKFASDVWKRR